MFLPKCIHLAVFKEQILAFAILRTFIQTVITISNIDH